VRVQRGERPVEEPAPAPEPRAAAPVDVGRHDVVERQADAERAAEGPDLLDPAAPREH
jgi:hypothetical protein